MLPLPLHLPKAPLQRHDAPARRAFEAKHRELVQGAGHGHVDEIALQALGERGFQVWSGGSILGR